MDPDTYDSEDVKGDARQSELEKYSLFPMYPTGKDFLLHSLGLMTNSST
jgi:hypothetical protein